LTCSSLSRSINAFTAIVVGPLRFSIGSRGK
jgi:hypothetical protein